MLKLYLGLKQMLIPNEWFISLDKDNLWFLNDNGNNIML